MSRKLVPAVITFRTKLREISNVDGSNPEPYFDYKKVVSRRDCNLKPHEHDYYNSDLFKGMLQRAYDAARDGKDWVRLSQLPARVTVDASGFLATVTVHVEV